MIHQEFPSYIFERLGYYVYLLRDPSGSICSTAERVGGSWVNGKSGATDLALKISAAQAERSPAGVRKYSLPPFLKFNVQRRVIALRGIL
jgi:hypothetical protein